MAEVRARVSSKGQITLPKAVRDALGIETGTVVEIEVKDDRATLQPVRGGFLDLFGSVKPPPGYDWSREREETREWVARRAIERAERWSGATE